MALVRLMTPALAATNAHCSRSGTRPATEEMLTMRPHFCARIVPATIAAHDVQPGQVDPDDPFPLLERELVDRHAVAHRVHAGVVDQDVQVAVFADDAVHHGLHLLLVADVHLHGYRPGLCAAARCTSATSTSE